MKVLGIDAATKTGWGIVQRPDGRAEELVGHGVIKPRDPDVIDEFVTEIFEQHPDLDAVYIERPYMLRNPGTTIMLSMLVGAFRFAFSRRVPVTLTPPSEWQHSVLAGLLPTKGRVTNKHTKPAAKLWVKMRFGIDVTEDEADAICVSFYGLRQRLLVG